MASTSGAGSAFTDHSNGPRDGGIGVNVKFAPNARMSCPCATNSVIRCHGTSYGGDAWDDPKSSCGPPARASPSGHRSPALAPAGEARALSVSRKALRIRDLGTTLESELSGLV